MSFRPKMQVACVININGIGAVGKGKKKDQEGDIEARKIAYGQLQKACDG